MARPSTKPYEHVVDDGSFTRAPDDLVSSDPLDYPGYPDALEEARSSSGGDESVHAGAATVGGHAVEIAAFDFSFLGGSMGEVAGERVARAMERAAERSTPFILRAATGGARMQEGMRALIQMPKLVAARAALTDAHVVYIAVLGDPSTGGVLASVGALADITIAELGATVGFAGPRVVAAFTGTPPSVLSHTATSALANGMIDMVVATDQVHAAVGGILEVLQSDAPTETTALPDTTVRELDTTVRELDTTVRDIDATARDLDAWDAVRAARSVDRPTGPELARAMSDGFVELRGDRSGTDDRSLIGALARVRGRRVVLLALDRAATPGPGAFRKARRCIALARRLALPIVTLVDTPGADPSESSEAHGIAWEIAGLFDDMLAADVPIISVVTGEGGSGGALAFATGDVILVYEHAIFSVIGPEAAAAILWRDPGRAPDAARALKLTAADLVRMGIADHLLSEPLTNDSVADAVAYHLDRTDGSAPDLGAARRKRWRDLGG